MNAPSINLSCMLDDRPVCRVENQLATSKTGCLCLEDLRDFVFLATEQCEVQVGADPGVQDLKLIVEIKGAGGRLLGLRTQYIGTGGRPLCVNDLEQLALPISCGPSVKLTYPLNRRDLNRPETARTVAVKLFETFNGYPAHAWRGAIEKVLFEPFHEPSGPSILNGSPNVLTTKMCRGQRVSPQCRYPVSTTGAPLV